MRENQSETVTQVCGRGLHDIWVNGASDSEWGDSDAGRLEKAKVSVFCLTYNHSRYIKAALEGMLNQKTSFAYNILVFDDASCDGTSEILAEYQERYKDVLKVYTAAENTYGKSERQAILQKLYDEYLTGEYIACCEGDDVWLDEHKIQMQIDYMDHDPQCMMTVHAYVLKDYRKKEEHIVRLGNSDRYLSAEEVILQSQGNPATASLVMRRHIFFGDKEYPVCDVGDQPMQLYALCHGKIFYIDKVMSAYRYMHDGSWSQNVMEVPEQRIPHILHFVDFLKAYNNYSNGQFKNLLDKKIVNYLLLAVPLELSIEEYEEKKNCLYQRIAEEYFYWTDQIDSIFYWLKGAYQFNETERDWIEGYPYVCIMGNGNYGRITEEVLKRNHIACVGHIVSARNEEEKDDGLWEVEEYPFDRAKTLVVVGISQMNRDGILQMLNAFEFGNILTPFWFDGV